MKLFHTLSILALATASLVSHAETTVKDSSYLPKKSKVSVKSDELTKVGYSFGYMMGDGNKGTATDLMLDAYFQGFRDAYVGNTPALTEEQIKQTLMDYQTRKETEYAKEIEALAKKNLEKGKAYLAENGKKTGVITTKSGLQYNVITQGTGKRPTATDTVKVHYEGKLIDGTVFDNSYKRGEPITLPLNEVITGWTEGLQLMPMGSKYHFVVPADLGYGEAGMTDIEPNSVLIFDVELLEINPKSDENK